METLGETSSPFTNFDQLPVELRAKIISRLTPADVQAAAKVSKKWRIGILEGVSNLEGYLINVYISAIQGGLPAESCKGQIDALSEINTSPIPRHFDNFGTIKTDIENIKSLILAVLRTLPLSFNSFDSLHTVVRHRLSNKYLGRLPTGFFKLLHRAEIYNNIESLPNYQNRPDEKKQMISKLLFDLYWLGDRDKVIPLITHSSRAIPLGAQNSPRTLAILACISHELHFFSDFGRAFRYLIYFDSEDADNVIGRNHALKCVAIAYHKKGLIDEMLATIHRMSDEDWKRLAASEILPGLFSSGNFLAVMELAPLFGEEYKNACLAYIVNFTAQALINSWPILWIP